MSENAPDFPPNSDTAEPVQEAPFEASLEVEELVAVLNRAARDVHEVQERLQGAVERDATQPTPRTAAERKRAQGAVARAELRDVVLRAVWDSGGREKEIAHARFENVRARRDGVALVRVLAKRGRWRLVAFSPPTWSGIRAWHLEHAGRVPAVGPIFPGAKPGEPIGLRALERAVHDIATRAGVQRLVGRDKKSHRYHITLKAIRELAEAHAVYDLGFNAKLAARVHDHTEIVQERHYLRARADAAARMALARAHVHAV